MGGRLGPLPEVVKPIAGSRLPNRKRDSEVSEVCATEVRLRELSELGVYDLGVPGAVLLGVSLGLMSLDGGCESLDGPTEFDGCCFGCEDTGSARCGDVDL